MENLLSDVGNGCRNQPDDVTKVQILLNKALPFLALATDGRFVSATLSAIDYFQGCVLGTRPDGRVVPNGATWVALTRWAARSGEVVDSLALPETGSSGRIAAVDFIPLATTLDCEVAAVRAVAEVESSGQGFLACGKPKILYEAHIFSRRTQHRFDWDYSSVSVRRQNRKLYKGGAAEYDRLAVAMVLDRTEALKSASWGMFQIMGFNHAACGHASVESFVEDMFVSEARQAKAFVRFIQSRGLGTHLKNKAWARLAAGYNGEDYASNNYDGKMAVAYRKYAALP